MKTAERTHKEVSTLLPEPDNAGVGTIQNFYLPLFFADFEKRVFLWEKRQNQ